MKKDRDAYIVLAPLGKSKIYSVAARRIGSKDRYSVVATCTSDTMAQSIVEALRLLQGEVLEIDTVSQRTLVDVREQNSKLRVESDEWRSKFRGLEHELRRAKQDLDSAHRERDTAQKAARESA